MKSMAGKLLLGASSSSLRLDKRDARAHKRDVRPEAPGKERGGERAGSLDAYIEKRKRK